jgi:hypothetical protein
MAISFDTLVSTMNHLYKELYRQDLAIDYKYEIFKMVKEFNPIYTKVLDDIEFDGEKFYLLIKELPVGTEFYETVEDANEFY